LGGLGRAVLGEEVAGARSRLESVSKSAAECQALNLSLDLKGENISNISMDITRVLTWAGVNVRSSPKITAESPVMWGVAMEVPLRICEEESEVMPHEMISAPGAKTSTLALDKR
jgi:hypothetical protein